MLKLAWRFMASRRFRSLSGVVSIMLGTALLAALLTLGHSLQISLDLANAPQQGSLRDNLDSLRFLAYGMGMAAMLAAAFLLSASFRIALTERRSELALLRTIGAGPAQVQRMVLTEGLLLGSAGSFLGVGLGSAAALLSARTAADMLGVQPGSVSMPWGQLVAVGIGGVVLTLFSAWRVAKDAGRTAPLESLRPDLSVQTREARQGGLFGLVLAGAGTVALAATTLVSDQVWAGGLRALNGALGGLAIGLGLLLGIPRLLPLLLSVLTFPWPGRQESSLAVRSLLRHRRRSGLTVGATALGLIMVIAIGTLSSTLLDRWSADVERQHPSDLQVAPLVMPGRLPADLAGQMAQIPGVTRVTAVGDGAQALLVDYERGRLSPAYLSKMANIQAQLGPQLTGVPEMWQRLKLSPADPAGLVETGVIRINAGSLDRWDDHALALSLTQAEGLGLKVGDQLTLNVNQSSLLQAVADPQTQRFTVTAIFTTALYRMPTALIAHPLPGAPQSLLLLFGSVAPGQVATVRPQAQQLLARPEYRNAEYSDIEQAIADFRAQTYQRFVLVLAVGLVMAAVAAMSLLNTMVSSINERKREFALLRSVGATARQVRHMVLLESALLGLVGGLVGIAGGATLGSGALIGLDLPVADLRLPWLLMAAGLGIALLLALAAAAGPARQVTRSSPAEAMRHE